MQAEQAGTKPSPFNEGLIQDSKQLRKLLERNEPGWSRQANGNYVYKNPAMLEYEELQSTQRNCKHIALVYSLLQRMLNDVIPGVLHIHFLL